MIKTLSKLKVPKEDKVIFADANYLNWPDLVESNHAVISKQKYRPQERKEILNIISDYTTRISGKKPVFDGDEKIIATGHQISWHHCGIAAKNMAASKLAKDINGFAVHLVLDNDVNDTDMILPSCNDGFWKFENNRIDNSPQRIALEFRKAPNWQLIRNFFERIENYNRDCLCIDRWFRALRSNIERIEHFSGLSDFITFLESILYSSIGIELLYLPVSKMCESRSFLTFIDSILNDGLNFASQYNKAIQNEPKLFMKELVICTEDKITELPFWLIDHNGKRDSLFLREISTNAIQIETQQQIIGRIDSSQQENRIEQLNNILKQSGFCIRPKAVTLTLFVRLFLADFFIHGIGGARYEAVTDYLLENFFNCPLLTFGTVTMTMKLDLEKWHNNPAEILREINNSPEDFISEHVFDNYKVRKLIKTKKEMITAAADKDKSKLQRRSAWEKITDINKELISYVDVEYKEIISKLTKCESSKEVLEYREFFFGLFEEDVLREVFN